MFDISSLITELIWKSYRKKPLLTVFGIFFTITLIIGGAITAQYLEKRDFKKSAPENIVAQIQELEKLDAGLQKLTAFIAVQKDELTEKQAVIKQLEEKRTELEPIVRSQSEVVDAIFKVQEQRAKKQKWFDLSIGFVLGILGSLIASVIFKLINRSKNA